MLSEFTHSLIIIPDLLVLTNLLDSDAERIAQVCSQKAVSEQLLKLPDPYTIKDAEDFIHYAATVAVTTHSIWAIRTLPDYNFIGEISYRKKTAETAFLGFYLDPGMQRRGFMAQILPKFITEIVWKQGFTRIENGVLIENIASQRLHQKVGFQRSESQTTVFHTIQGLPKAAVIYTIEKVA